MDPLKIHLSFPELRYQRPTRKIANVLEFDGEIVTRRYEFYASEPQYSEDGSEDPKLPWEDDVYNKQIITFHKTMLSAIELVHGIICKWSCRRCKSLLQDRDKGARGI